MKTCKLCSSEIPTTVVIEGVEHNLQRRKYCLGCSPYGSHNTHSLLLNDAGLAVHVRVGVSPSGISTCTRCQRKYVFDKTKGHQLVLCNSCVANRRRVQTKERCVQYKGGRCLVCGYSKCLRALEFHHRDRTLKEFSLGGKMSWKWERLTIELDKCDMLCSNCHREEEDSLIQVVKF
jgi:hypothetical protein